MEALGSKLKKLRQKAGLTQKQVGDLLHVSYQAVSKWERNLGLPDPSLFPEIAKALNTTVNELFYENAPVSAGEGAASVSQKSAYKPVNRKFLIILISVITIIAVLTATISVYFVRQNRFKNQIVVASEIFAEENNVSVKAKFNDKEYSFIRKYFFDGRVLIRYENAATTQYYYKDNLYTEAETGLETENSNLQDYLSTIPDFWTLNISYDQIKSIKNRNGEFVFKLKNLDNLPIAQYFGFSKEAVLHLNLSGGKIRGVTVTEGENTLNIDYLFGYNFTIDLPDYINP